MTCKDEVVKSLKQTSVKGVPRWFRAESPCLKILWAFAIVAFFAFGSYQSYELICEYLKYPKMTLIEEREFSMDTDLVFPNLQICSVNSMGLLRNVSNNETFEFYQRLVENVITCSECSADDKELLGKLREGFLSAYGYIAYVGVENVLRLMEDYPDFLIECLVFTIDSYVGNDCETLADITIVPSFDYLLCLRLKFLDSEVIDKVSMTFYLDSFANEDFIRIQQRQHLGDEVFRRRVLHILR